MLDFLTLFILFAGLHQAQAHFRVRFPGERNATNWDTQSQGPCGGANEVVLPRFEWNPDGSPVELYLSHELTLGAMYYCPLENCTTNDDFNITIYETFEVAGSGNFCFPAIEIPYDVGSVGTVQVVTRAAGISVGDYEEFFNCVDVVISEDGPENNGTQCSDTSLDSESEEDIVPYTINSDKLYNATNITALDSYIVEALKTATSSSAGASSSANSTAVSLTTDSATSTSESTSLGSASKTGGTFFLSIFALVLDHFFF